MRFVLSTWAETDGSDARTEAMSQQVAQAVPAEAAQASSATEASADEHAEHLSVEQAALEQGLAAEPAASEPAITLWPSSGVLLASAAGGASQRL